MDHSTKTLINLSQLKFSKAQLNFAKSYRRSPPRASPVARGVVHCGRKKEKTQWRKSGCYGREKKDERDKIWLETKDIRCGVEWAM